MKENKGLKIGIAIGIIAFMVIGAIGLVWDHTQDQPTNMVEFPVHYFAQELNPLTNESEWCVKFDVFTSAGDRLGYCNPELPEKDMLIEMEIKGHGLYRAVVSPNETGVWENGTI